jgi:hypothetical protein
LKKRKKRIKENKMFIIIKEKMYNVDHIIKMGCDSYGFFIENDALQHFQVKDNKKVLQIIKEMLQYKHAYVDLTEEIVEDNNE